MSEQHHFAMPTVAEQSTDYQRVLWTGRHAQLVVMAIPAGTDTGEEIHDHTDQILGVLSGTGEARLLDETVSLEHGDVVVVPAGTRHIVANTGAGPLVLQSVYAPAAHAIDAVYPTKADAAAAEATGEDEPPPAL